MNDPYYLELKNRISAMLDKIYGTIEYRNDYKFMMAPHLYTDPEYIKFYLPAVNQRRTSLVIANISRQYCGEVTPKSETSKDHLLSINTTCAAFKAIYFKNWYWHMTKANCIDLLTPTVSARKALDFINMKIKNGEYHQLTDGFNKKNNYIIPSLLTMRKRAVGSFASYVDSTAHFNNEMFNDESSLKWRSDYWIKSLGFDKSIQDFATSSKISEYKIAKEKVENQKLASQKV